MKKLSLYLLLLVSFLQPQRMIASHAMGGELTYTWLNGNTYEVQFTFYRDCQGISAPVSVDVQYYSSCNPIAQVITLNATLSSPQQVAPVCPQVAGLTNCNTGTINGIEKWVYIGSVTLPGACADWTFDYTECCRNGTITNIQNPANDAAYFSALLNNLNAPFNSSARFSNNPVPFLYAGTTNTINNGAFDPENDSLVISLAPALSAAGTPVVYTSPLTFDTPVTASAPIVVDPATGNVIISPTQQEVDVVVYRVDEYRNGILVGSSSRDFQITVLPGGNQLPALSGINGTPSYSINSCAGDTIGFMIYSSDADVNDSTFFTIESSGIGSIISATTFGGAQDSMYIELITDGSLVSPLAHTLYITVRDNTCPYVGQQSYAYQIYVNGCSANVWPGDANNDLQCDLYDILPLGLGFNATGPIRPGASIAWTAQSCADWTQQFFTGTNYKFADCNGDGVINNNDTTAIVLNYGQTHPVRMANPGNHQSTVGNMYLVSSTDTVGPTDHMTVEVRMGDVANPARRIYGIAFKLLFNPMILDPSSSVFNFTNSQLGNPANDLLTFTHTDWTNGVIDAVAVRMDGNEQTIDSTIAAYDVVIVDNVSARTVVGFDLAGVRAIDATGLAKFFNIINDSVNVISGATGILPLLSESVYLYPNPTDKAVRIHGASSIQSVLVYDLNGQTVFKTDAEWSGSSISTASLPTGIYFMEIKIKDATIRKKFNVVH